MKRSMLIVSLGVLLMCGLFVAAEGAPKKSDRKAPRGAVEGEPPPEATVSTVALPASQTQVPVVIQSRIEAAAAASNYEMPWQTVNAGGAPCASHNYSVNASVGQSAIGYAASAGYEAGIGYWYGAGGACNCPYQSDYEPQPEPPDGFLDALDLSALIDVLFAGRPDVTDPMCPTSRGDFNNDGQPDALDLSGLIDHLFAGQPGPCDPCNPVQSTCAK